MAHDEAARLQALLITLDRAGLPGTFPEARALLERAAEVEQHTEDQAAAAERTRRELTAQVLKGDLTLDDAAHQLAALAVWLPSGEPAEGRRRGRTLADTVAEPVARNLRRLSVQAARSGGLDAHAALAKLAAEAVKRSVDAGKRLIDVRAIARLLTPPKPTGAQVMRGNALVAAPHPWVDNPPRLPSLDLADVQRDPARMAAWAEAADAYAAFLAVHELAAQLHAVTGGSSTTFAAGKVDRDVWHFIAGGLPDVVHLAVADALGWKPGLHLSLKPMRVRPDAAPANRMEGWATPAQQQSAMRRLLGAGRGV